MNGAFFRRGTNHILAVQQDMAGVGQIESGDHAQQCGFAATGRPQQSEKFTRFDTDADVVYCGEIAKAPCHITDFK